MKVHETIEITGHNYSEIYSSQEIDVAGETPEEVERLFNWDFWEPLELEDGEDDIEITVSYESIDSHPIFGEPFATFKTWQSEILNEKMKYNMPENELLEKLHELEGETEIYFGLNENSTKEDLINAIHCLECEDVILEGYVKSIQTTYPSIYNSIKKIINNPEWKTNPSERLLVFNTAHTLFTNKDLFVEVIGDDGKFYDLVNRSCVEKHIKSLTEDEGYQARIIEESKVPPCKYRVLASDLSFYWEDSLRNGEIFYFDQGEV